MYIYTNTVQILHVRLHINHVQVYPWISVGLCPCPVVLLDLPDFRIPFK